MDAICDEETRNAEVAYLNDPTDLAKWGCFFGLSQQKLLQLGTNCTENTSVALDVLCRRISAEATVEREWAAGLVALSIHDDVVGWLEFDISARNLPPGTRKGDRVPVHLRVDSEGAVLSCQIFPKSGRTQGPANPLDMGLPPPPKHWNNPAEVAEYKRALQAWEGKAGLRRPAPGEHEP